ncbi:MAG: DUF4258 domain-containing protein [Bacteroidota bacterium]|nr:DUF4258 domain-containing protein [Bacteroidota bacterium]
MAIPGKNSDLFRRFKLYGFGLLLGILAVSVLYKGKGCQMPGSAKLEELSYQKIEYTQHGECRMKCRNISESDIKELLKSGKINYDKSAVRDKPCGTYALEGKTAGGKNLRIILADCDTISKVVTAMNLSVGSEEEVKDSCACE